MTGVRRVDNGIGQSDFTLGQLIGELGGKIDGMKTEIALLRADVQTQGQDLKALQTSNSSWRWAERVGTILGGVLGGFFGGRTTGI